MARHERCYRRQQQILDLEHYLDVLFRKPGALAGSKPLEQKRQAGLWPSSFDRIWQALIERHGKQSGTKQMIDLLKLSQKYGHQKLQDAIESALASGCYDAAAVQHLLNARRTAAYRLRSDRRRLLGTLRTAPSRDARIRSTAQRRSERNEQADGAVTRSHHQSSLQDAAHADGGFAVWQLGRTGDPREAEPYRVSRSATGWPRSKSGNATRSSGAFGKLICRA